MSRARLAVFVPVVVATLVLLWTQDARAEWNYRDGFGYESDSFALRLNAFLQPRYEYSSNDGTGGSTSSFRLNIVGGRMRVWMPRRRIFLQVMGGASGQEALLLDSYFEIGIGERLKLRVGYFRVPFDEQTTHAPFWLRMTERSVDVRSLSHYYDLGIALRGNHLDNALAWALSMSNGEIPVWENANIDFLYSFRLALRFGQLFGWYRTDLVLGTGTSWTLEPWEPEPDVEVNRSLFAETLDLTLKVSSISITSALLYRLTTPGAYGPNAHALGWHGEVGASIAEIIELAVRVAQVWPDLRGDTEIEDHRQLEVGVVLNGFGDEGRLRFQLEYRYLRETDGAGVEVFDAHRAVLQFQAFY